MRYGDVGASSTSGDYIPVLLPHEIRRDNNPWKKAIDTVKDKGGTVSFEVLKALLISLVREQIGLAP